MPLRYTLTYLAPYLCGIFFWNPIESNLCFPRTPGCAVVHWCLVSLPGAIPPRENCVSLSQKPSTVNNSLFRGREWELSPVGVRLLDLLRPSMAAGIPWRKPPCHIHKTLLHSSLPRPLAIRNFAPPFPWFFLRLGGKGWYRCPFTAEPSIEFVSALSPVMSF